MKRTWQIFLLVMLAVGVGCVPLPRKATSGTDFSKEAVTFLDSPGTTRQNVLASFGKPDLDMSDPGVMAYTSETRSQYWGYFPTGRIYDWNLECKFTTAEGDPKDWTLFIAYDQQELVIAHKVYRGKAQDLSKACLDWRSRVGHETTQDNK